VGGKTEPEARDNFVHFLRETLSCITSNELTAFQESKKLFKVWFNPPARVRLRKGGSSYISVTQIFTVVPDEVGGGFKAKTREYSYRFSRDSDVNSAGIFAYHWHPNDFAIRFPHLHVAEIRRVHFPTSRVSLEDFVAMLIDYYDVRPVLAESRWKAILKKNKLAFEKMATWKIQHP
jgi:hypothetical protein